MNIGIFLFFAVAFSKTFLTHIKIDGYPIQSFATTKHEYFISIPYSKQTTRIEAFTNNPLKPARINSINGAEFLMGSTLQLNGFDTFIISYGSPKTEKSSKKYKVHFVQVSPITMPIHVSSHSRLTPNEEPQSPLINSAKVIGSLPNTEFQHYISTTGERPITYTANGLPSSLQLNENTGIITGRSPSEKGEYTVQITATNSFGSDSVNIKIVIGDKQRLTPVQGWSSWYTQSQAISEDGVLKMAESAIKSRINDYGFVYLNIDDCWQGNRTEEKPPKLTGKRPFINNGVTYGGFPNMTNLTSYIHSIGLKIGIYSGPKPSTYAGFLGSSSFNSSGMDYNNFSPYNGNDNSRGPKFDDTGSGSGSDGLPGVYQPSQYYGSWFSGYESSPGGKEVGPFWFGEVDVATFSEWGFDFMKWDWLLYGNVTLTKELTKSLTQASSSSGRSIVLSLSNNVGHNHELMQSVKDIGASMARITTDISDNWFSMSSAASEALYFIDIAGNGFYPDPDMLQIGYIGTPNGLNTKFHKTHLAKVEQYFQLSFWAIYPAPMILSCDLSQLDGDDFTMGLLKNREVILINQDSLGIPSKKLKDNSDDVIVRELDDGSVALGVFNFVIMERNLNIYLADIEKVTGVKFPKGATLRSVWEQKDVGVVDGNFTITLEGHQGLLYKLIPIV
ncbi:hypothetical protein M9Y10_020061 [Tritrichomonas musculus]|uniref:Alpha-galactosidase n=1 Tax=Tritrichomonas musculus TaxID=1915356 RepID=A0ABR2HG84_9EUKA